MLYLRPRFCISAFYRLLCLRASTNETMSRALNWVGLAKLEPTPPYVFGECVETTNLLIDTLRNEVHAAGAAFFLALFVNPRPGETAEIREVYAPPPINQRGREGYAVDLTLELMKLNVDKDVIRFPHNQHLNPAGNELVAELIARALIERGMVTPGVGH